MEAAAFRLLLLIDRPLVKRRRARADSRGRTPNDASHIDPSISDRADSSFLHESRSCQDPIHAADPSQRCVSPSSFCSDLNPFRSRVFTSIGSVAGDVVLRIVISVSLPLP
ncbi:hypothetical protein OPV22_022919 [Ensete ventricosum]|uniref:Uncharacterized protein n=1 Tax=Ensete ventricosum TaxID=4639 RepID=A0AAV8QRT6_ENSVE|nr:hypothetical protein OPV22_022919 [Ensete ventricosum]